MRAPDCSPARAICLGRCVSAAGTARRYPSRHAGRPDMFSMLPSGARRVMALAVRSSMVFGRPAQRAGHFASRGTLDSPAPSKRISTMAGEVQWS
jgi:hypothetical protein